VIRFISCMKLNHSNDSGNIFTDLFSYYRMNERKW